MCTDCAKENKFFTKNTILYFYSMKKHNNITKNMLSLKALQQEIEA
jgi:hypothetical protein